MAKTNPIGVRFDKDLLEKLISDEIITSPQKALNLFERTYLESITPKNYTNVISEIPPNQGNVEEANEALHENVLAEIERNGILEEIKRLQAEKIPPERNTQLGKKYWLRDQTNAINKLKEKLKTN